MANQSISVETRELPTQVSDASAVFNPYRARYASIADALAIDFVIKEAFGNTAPRSSAAREMKRRNTVYIVVTKDAEGADPSDPMNHYVGGGWKQRLKSVFSTPVGNLEPPRNSRSIVGLVGIWTAVDQAHIVVFASRPAERRRGVGELLIISTLCEAIKSGATNATLEVRKSNQAARLLYRKYGFNDIGIRRRYYADNREDAVIMATPSFANLDYMRSLRRRCDSYFAVRGKTQLHVEIAQLLALPE